MKRRSIYLPAKHKYLADIVSLKDPESANRSVFRLEREFRQAKTNTKKVRVFRATRLASTRAWLTLNRENLSDNERKEFRELSKIYYDASQRMQKKLRS